MPLSSFVTVYVALPFVCSSPDLTRAAPIDPTVGAKAPTCRTRSTNRRPSNPRHRDLHGASVSTLSSPPFYPVTQFYSV